MDDIYFHIRQKSCYISILFVFSSQAMLQLDCGFYHYLQLIMTLFICTLVSCYERVLRRKIINTRQKATRDYLGMS